MGKNLLAEIRNEKRLTQVKMAKMLGISVAAYNLYENGGRKIPSAIAEKISQILGINKNEIFMPVTFALRKSEPNHSPNKTGTED